MKLRLLALPLALLLALSTLATGAPQEPAEGPIRYALVSSDAARVRNLADDRGNELVAPKVGTLVAVHRELAGWLEVEVPGGYAVWVHGRYLRATSEADVYEVTRNAVNMRPAPKSDVTNFPLPQRLHAGDRVRGIERLEPQVDVAQTWMRVWSPPGVTAWIRADQTRPLAPGDDGARLWSKAVAETTNQAPSKPKPAENGSPLVGGTAEEAARRQAETKAQDGIAAARKLLEAESTKDTPDYGAVREALEDILERSPSVAITASARNELEMVSHLEEAAALRAELERERQRRTEEALARQRQVWEAAREKDPLGGVFRSRGILERQLGTDGTPRYFLRFGGERRSELVCATGRYDLDVFSGFEVGVFGDELATTTGVTTPVIDLRRIEILARR